MSQISISSDERLWGLLAWALLIVGAVIALIFRSGSRYVRYWAYLSISFTIVIIVAFAISMILSLIPFIGWVLGILIDLFLVITYIIGLVKVLSDEAWRPPVVYDVARVIGIERI